MNDSDISLSFFVLALLPLCFLPSSPPLSCTPRRPMATPTKLTDVTPSPPLPGSYSDNNMPKPLPTQATPCLDTIKVSRCTTKVAKNKCGAQKARKKCGHTCGVCTQTTIG